MQTEAQYNEAKLKIKFLLQWVLLVPFLISIFFVQTLFDFGALIFYELLLLMQLGFLVYYLITFKEIAKPLIGTKREKAQTVIYRFFTIVWMELFAFFVFWEVALLALQNKNLTLSHIFLLICSNFFLFAIGVILFLVLNIYPPKIAKKYNLVCLKRKSDLIFIDPTQTEAQHKEAKLKVKFFVEWVWFVPFLISVLLIPMVFFDFELSTYYGLLLLMQLGFLIYYLVTFKEISTPLVGTAWEKIGTGVYRVILIVFLEFGFILSFWGMLFAIEKTRELIVLCASYLILSNFFLLAIGVILFLVPNVYPPKMAKKYNLVYLKRTPDKK